MKNNLILICTVVVLLMQAVTTASATNLSSRTNKTTMLLLSRDMILEPGDETRTLIGVYGGVNFNTHSGTFALVDGNLPCCTFNEGTGIGAVLGVKAFIPIASNLYFSPRLAYEGRGGTLKASEFTNDIIGADNIKEKATFRNEMVTTLPALNIDLLATYTFIPDYGLYVAAGVSGAYILSKNYSVSENILAPTGVTYSGTNSTSKEISSSSFTVFNSIQIGIRLGIGATISINDNIYINPEVLYHLSLTTLSTQSGSDWKSSLIQPTLGILFTL